MNMRLNTKHLRDTKTWPAVLCVLCLLLVQVAAGAQKQQTAMFTVGSATAAPGEKATGVIPVPAGVDLGSNIPVVVLQGRQQGPVLAIAAGAHGTEYASVVAVEQLISVINPDELAGTVILLPLINIASFEQKTVHINPVDGKNMNRMYPGRLNGTQTERISYFITSQVVERCDHLIDMHGGDLDESLRPYSYWSKSGNDKQDVISRDMALAFGLDHIIIVSDRPRDPQQSRYLENTATTRGKPSITVEAGSAGTADSDDVTALVAGSLNVMRYLKMLPHPPERVENPVWLDTLVSLLSEQTGIFYPLVKKGTYAQKGMKLGYVTDYFGRTIFEARAPISGVVLYISAVPSMKKGDTIANMAAPVADPRSKPPERTSAP
jgi:predicted deacylase